MKEVTEEDAKKTPLFIGVAIASLLGTGFAPKAPGTVGSIVALGILFIPWGNYSVALWIASAVGFVLGMLTIARVEQRYGNDPSCVVIDEAVGMWLVLATPLVPRNLTWVIVALALFRLFDIWKPFPIRWFNNQRGSFYVLMDDVVAAAFASIVLHSLFFASQYFFPSSSNPHL